MKTCLNCNKEFTPKRDSAFCSKSCYYHYYYMVHIEKRKAYFKGRYIAHPRQRTKEEIALSEERKKQRRKEYYEINKEYYKNYNKEYYHKHKNTKEFKERRSRVMKAYYKRRKEKC